MTSRAISRALRRITGLASTQSTSYHTDPISAIKSTDDLFSLTRYRSIRNGVETSQSRYRAYDSLALGKIAANAVGSESCHSIVKCVEGRYNITLLLTMDDGKEVIVKLPTPVAGPPRYTVANEVATLQFYREHSFPVPQVYTWCNSTEGNPVGAEYIVMEKAQGVTLAEAWIHLSCDAKIHLLVAIFSWQRRALAIEFPAYGSLYFADDVRDIDHQPIEQLHRAGLGISQTTNRYAIAQSVGRKWYDDGRAPIVINRGPWKHAADYFDAIVQREETCIDSMQELPLPEDYICGPTFYIPDRRRKKQAVAAYRTVIRPTIFSGSIDTMRPASWHPDIHAENIFVTVEDQPKITAFIDWQSSEVLPAFLQSHCPYMFRQSGVTGEPQVPSYSQCTTQKQKDDVTNQYMAELFQDLWNQAVNRTPTWAALDQFRKSIGARFLSGTRNLLVQSELQLLLIAHYYAEEMGITSAAPGHAGAINSPDLSGLLTDFDAQQEGARVMSDLQEELGDLFPHNGCVKPSDYDYVLSVLQAKLKSLMAQSNDSMAHEQSWLKYWPFHTV